MSDSPSPKGRFSNRVEAYVRFRPGYPRTLIDYLVQTTGLGADWSVADVGSGTGLLTQRLVEFGCRVFAVEPNDAMRAAGARAIGSSDQLTSVNGTAERTTLESNSVDLVTAAQAYHWFDAQKARAEFARILKPPYWVALVWNTRVVDANAFMRAYEQLLLDHSVDYASVDHRRSRDRVGSFFDRFTRGAIQFSERLEFDHALGRMLSASYVPAAGHPGHDRIVTGLREAFDAFQQGGRVVYTYQTEVFVGTIPPSKTD